MIMLHHITDKHSK